MGIKIYKLLFMSMLMLLTGCNGDIFVEDFLPGEQMDVVL